LRIGSFWASFYTEGRGPIYWTPPTAGPTVADDHCRSQAVRAAHAIGDPYPPASWQPTCRGPLRPAERILGPGCETGRKGISLHKNVGQPTKLPRTDVLGHEKWQGYRDQADDQAGIAANRAFRCAGSGCWTGASWTKRLFFSAWSASLVHACAMSSSSSFVWVSLASLAKRTQVSAH